MARPINPYVAGNPIRGKNFFGRADIMYWVAQELRNPGTSAIVLFGQRRIGKTTLLLQLRDFLSPKEFLPIFFDLQDQTSNSLDRVLIALADEMADSVGMEVSHEAFDPRGRFFKKNFLPKFFERLGKDIRPVFLLDEFDVFDKHKDEVNNDAAANTFFPFLRQLMIEFPLLAFVFVAGRNPGDLSLDFSAAFKSSLVKEIWVLDEENAEKLVRQAEANGTLVFADSAIRRILELTHGHPYLTQLLCQRIWERAYTGGTEISKQIYYPDVEASIEDTLRTGEAAFDWLWKGLSNSERIYAAALAEISEENKPISEVAVNQVLSEYASRLRTPEVELAPRDLVKRRVLEDVGDQQFSFAIELLRRWVCKNQLLKTLKEGFDNEGQATDANYLKGINLFQKNKWSEAREFFEKAISENPTNFKSYIYLGETLLKLNRNRDAIEVLTNAWQIDQNEARLPLTRAWVNNAVELQKVGDDKNALISCDKALELSPHERDAQLIKSAIWNKTGDRLFKQRNWNAAVQAYQKAENFEKVDVSRERLLKRNSKFRQLLSFVWHLAVVCLGFYIDKWLGLIFISTTFLLLYYSFLYSLANILLPISHINDRAEKWKRYLIFVSYTWGVQSDLYNVEEHAWSKIKPRIYGDSTLDFSDFLPKTNNTLGRSGLVWMPSHQVAAIAGGTIFNRIDGPGLVFTNKLERPVQFIDLRLQLRASEIEVVSKDGIRFLALIFTTFRIDNEEWSKETYDTLRTLNPILRGANRLSYTKGSYPFSHTRIQSVLAVTGSKAIPTSQVVYWDQWALNLIEGQARKTISQKNLDELWRPVEDKKFANALDVIANEIKENTIVTLRSVGILLLTARVVNFRFARDNEKEDGITRQLIESWVADWKKKRMKILSDAEEESERAQMEAKAYAESVLLDSIADGLRKTQQINPELPRYVIAMRFLSSLQDYVEKHPGMNVEDVNKKFDEWKNLFSHDDKEP